MAGDGSLVAHLQRCAMEKAVQVQKLEGMLYAFPTVIIGVCVVSLICNLFLLFLLCRGVVKKVHFSKRLLFVGNRCVSDILAAGISVFYLFSVDTTCDSLDCFSESTYVPNLLMQAVITMNFWVLSVSYFGISFLTCYAVRFPLRYKFALSMKSVALWICYGWVGVFAALAVIYWTGLHPVFDSNGIAYLMHHRYHGLMDHWLVDLCVNANESAVKMGVINLILPIGSYVMTVIAYVFVLVVLYNRRRDNYIALRHQTGVWRLRVHIVIYTLSFSLMALAYGCTYSTAENCLAWSHQLTSDRNNASLASRFSAARRSPDCDLKYLSSFFTYGFLTFLSGFAWFTRMVLDSLIDSLTDRQLNQLIPSFKTSARNTTLILEPRPSYIPYSTNDPEETNHSTELRT